MVRISPIFLSPLGDLQGEQPYLGDLLTLVMNHLLSGMIHVEKVVGFLNGWEWKFGQESLWIPRSLDENSTHSR